MIITLKNNDRVELEWSLQVMEYLESYNTDEGTGYRLLVKDMRKGKNRLRIMNTFIYALIRSNYEKPLTYSEVLKLVNFKDYEKLASFVEKNLKELDDFKKKDQKYINHHPNKPKKKKKK